MLFHLGTLSNDASRNMHTACVQSVPVNRKTAWWTVSFFCVVANSFCCLARSFPLLSPPLASRHPSGQILALTCLISAYSLSVLYLDGVKYGDRQMTATGMLMAASLITISRSKPIDKLSPVRPLTSIFHPALFLSILGQVGFRQRKGW